MSAPAPHASVFHDLLSELNPLQYLPVVGTIYRAITGDTISETARETGSLVVSGLIGGPVGVVTNLATLAVEKVTGIDTESIGQEVLAYLGISHPAAVAEAAAQPAAAEPAAAPPMPPAASASNPVAWSPAQLTAYGVTMTAQGSLKRGAVEGADVLNTMELAQLGASSVAVTDAGRPALPNS